MPRAKTEDYFTVRIDKSLYDICKKMSKEEGISMREASKKIAAKQKRGILVEI